MSCVMSCVGYIGATGTTKAIDSEMALHVIGLVETSDDAIAWNARSGGEAIVGSRNNRQEMVQP